MSNLINLSSEVVMTSLEVVELINKFREEEGNHVVKRHADFIVSIEKEIASLENVGIPTKRNISLSSYSDGTRNYKCYQLDKSGIMQMLNKESAVVRYKTQQYIEALENELSNQQLPVLINTQQQQIEELKNLVNETRELIGIRCKDKFDFGNVIKNHLGITKADDDYKVIKQMFFFEKKVQKWEDIPYSRDNIKLLKDICNDYKPRKYKSLFSKK